MLAANTGDRDAFAFYLTSSYDKSFLDDLRNKVKASEEHIRRLCMELESSKEAASHLRELEEVTLSEKRLKAKVGELTAKLNNLERLVGPGVEDPVKTLVE